MAKWFRNILAVVILAVLVWYLIRHWHQLRVLLELQAEQIFLLYLLTFCQTVITAQVMRILLKALNTKTSFKEIFLLHSAATLLNYVPMKMGMIVRANYLKRRYGLSYTHFGAFFACVTLLMVSAAAAVGLVVILAAGLLTDNSPAAPAAMTLTIVFIIVLLTGLVLMFTPAPVNASKTPLFLQKFLSGRKMLAANKKAMLVSVLLLAVNFVIASARLAIIYDSLSQNVKPAGFLILGSLGFVVLFIGFTPGALGLREIVLGAGALVLNTSMQVGVMAAMMERVVLMTYFFVAGGMCAVWLWHKYPADFNKQSLALESSQINTDDKKLDEHNA